MDANDGWLPFPDLLLDYLNELDAKHWTDLYFKEGRERWRAQYAQELEAAKRAWNECLGENPNIQKINAVLLEMVGCLSEVVAKDDFSSIPGMEFLDYQLEDIQLSSFSQEELKNQRAVWIGYFVRFFNDLSIATHRESIFSLVQRAVEQRDMDAMTKAIQIDRSLLPYFKDQLLREAMRGNQGFFDQLAYRMKNPPKKGVNKHPLLWVLFHDLRTIRCLPLLRSSEILAFYQDAVGDYPKHAIYDELVVQRQKRQFMKMYRLPK
jgi:hypothetical protein